MERIMGGIEVRKIEQPWRPPAPTPKPVPKYIIGDIVRDPSNGQVSEVFDIIADAISGVTCFNYRIRPVAPTEWHPEESLTRYEKAPDRRRGH